MTEQANIWISDYERGSAIEHRLRALEGEPLDLRAATMLRADMRWLLDTFWRMRADAYRKEAELRKRLVWIASTLEALPLDLGDEEWSKIKGPNSTGRSGEY